MWALDQWKVNKGKIIIRRSQSSTIAPRYGIQDSLGFWILLHAFWIPGTAFQSFPVELGFKILFLSGILTVFCIPKPSIPDSISKIFLDSGVYRQIFSRFRNPDTFTGGEVVVKHFCTCSRIFNQAVGNLLFL